MTGCIVRTQVDGTAPPSLSTDDASLSATRFHRLPL